MFRMPQRKFFKTTFLVGRVIDINRAMTVRVDNLAHPLNARERGVVAGQVKELFMSEYTRSGFNVA